MRSLLDIVLERMTSSVIPGTPIGDQLLAVLQSLSPPDATQYFGAANDVLLAPSARTTASPASPRRRPLDRCVCVFPIKSDEDLRTTDGCTLAVPSDVWLPILDDK